MSFLDEKIGWYKLSWGKKILIGIPLMAAVLAWKYYDGKEKAESQAKDMKAEMIQMCDNDPACIAVVEEYAEACYKENYATTRKRNKVYVKMEDFVECVNSKSGTEFFSAE